MLTTTRLVTAAALLLALARSSTGADSPLLDAVKRRDAATVNMLLRQKADPDARQADGSTVLHWAAHRNEVAVASALIRAGAKVNVANELGVTPLLLACENGSGDLVTMLLAAGANPNAATAAGESPLMAAARSGSLAAVTALLKRGADPNAAETTRHQTPLMWAVAAQQPGVARLLLASGAQVHARTASNRQLVYTGFRYITSPPSESSNTVVEVDLGGFSPILFAAQQGNVEVATLLLDAGANKNEQSFLGQTALIIAAHSNHADLVRLLLQRGADPNTGDAGFSALHAAVLRGNVDIVNMLLEAHADPNARITRGEPVRKYGQEHAITASWKGATPLWLAARFVEPPIVRALRNGGADARIASADGTSPLFATVPAGSLASGDRRERYRTDVEAANFPPREDEHSTLDALEALLECGVTLDATDQAGNTLLHVAAPKGYDSVIEFLVAHGIDINAKNKRDATALGATMARWRAVAAATGADPEAAVTPEQNRTVALLRKLGAR
jgi:ankyrin repeat protein